MELSHGKMLNYSYFIDWQGAGAFREREERERGRGDEKKGISEPFSLSDGCG